MGVVEWVAIGVVCLVGLAVAADVFDRIRFPKWTIVPFAFIVLAAYFVILMKVIEINARN